MQRLFAEAPRETADKHHRVLLDPTGQMGEPFSNPLDAPEMLINLGQFLPGLHLAKSMTVLDCAVGTCWLSRYLGQMQCVTISLDASRAALKKGGRLLREYPLVGNALAPRAFLRFSERRIGLPDA